MDNFELYLYIILGVIYLISRLLKAKPAPPASGKRRSAQNETGETTKPFSFEDLFKEFEEQSQTEESPKRESPKPSFVKPGSSDYRRKAEERQEEISWAARRDEPATEYKTYESSGYEKYDINKGLNSMGSLLKTEKESEKEKKKAESNYYINLIKKSNGARDAFVMSEIFNKKY
ncbi:MAG: hypothetical protein JJU28_16265 [Cyclobacteriaceae bacterium]|nr:hypothetical protein [Cyclobacteriaceae bacterium]